MIIYETLQLVCSPPRTSNMTFSIAPCAERCFRTCQICLGSSVQNSLLVWWLFMVIFVMPMARVFSSRIFEKGFFSMLMMMCCICSSLLNSSAWFAIGWSMKRCGWRIQRPVCLKSRTLLQTQPALHYFMSSSFFSRCRRARKNSSWMFSIMRVPKELYFRPVHLINATKE